MTPGTPRSTCDARCAARAVETGAEDGGDGAGRAVAGAARLPSQTSTSRETAVGPREGGPVAADPAGEGARVGDDLEVPPGVEAVTGRDDACGRPPRGRRIPRPPGRRRRRSHGPWSRSVPVVCSWAPVSRMLSGTLNMPTMVVLRAAPRSRGPTRLPAGYRSVVLPLPARRAQAASASRPRWCGKALDACGGALVPCHVTRQDGRKEASAVQFTATTQRSLSAAPACFV